MCVFANLHGGWQVTINNIIKTLDLMFIVFGGWLESVAFQFLTFDSASRQQLSIDNIDNRYIKNCRMGKKKIRCGSTSL